MKIVVVGLGYVGAATAVLLAGKNRVLAIDPNAEKIEALKKGISPLPDASMESVFLREALNIEGSVHWDDLPADADFLVVAVPTNWSEDADTFDTHHVEDVVRLVENSHCQAAIVIRSTLPVGFTQTLEEKYPRRTFLFCPEFLREGSAMEDALHPQRIVIGRSGKSGEAMARAEQFAGLLKEGIRQLRPADFAELPVLLMETREAEAVKLFANTYLATRIAFFNELDAFAEQQGLDAARIIGGVCLDSRIGNQYNNPGFGYGGYCLPKDSRQLLHDAQSPHGSLLRAVVNSNEKRKEQIANQLAEMARQKAGAHAPVIGIYSLAAKVGSEDIRSASILDIIRQLLEKQISIVVYEPTLRNHEQLQQWLPGVDSASLRLEPDLAAFKKACHVIAANRWNRDLEDVGEKVYTRDIFGRN